jgi:hypothetical protein
MARPRRAPVIHLVGSVPLADAESVFRTVAAKAGPHLARLPDGETGKRINWIRVLQEMLAAHPAMEVDTATPPLKWVQWDGKVLREISLVKFKDGVDPSRVAFDTGYADAAIASFAVFDRLQREGAIPRGVKFQICIPTPLAPTYNYVSPRAQLRFLPVIEAALVKDVARIAASLPNERIAVQWDVCQEVLMWENWYPSRRPDYKAEIWGVLTRIGAAVPRAIELGYHLCYGSPQDQHIVQPKDTGVMVEMSNGLFARAMRPIEFLHLPVPKDRTDDGYFAPLADLKLPDGTDLYLGLIHYRDEDGDRARLARALAHAPVAGVGSECGWGRTDPKRVPELLDSHVRAIGQFARA